MRLFLYRARALVHCVYGVGKAYYYAYNDENCAGEAGSDINNYSGSSEISEEADVSVLYLGCVPYIQSPTEDDDVTHQHGYSVNVQCNSDLAVFPVPANGYPYVVQQ